MNGLVQIYDANLLQLLPITDATVARFLLDRAESFRTLTIISTFWAGDVGLSYTLIDFSQVDTNWIQLFTFI